MNTELMNVTYLLAVLASVITLLTRFGGWRLIKMTYSRKEQAFDTTLVDLIIFGFLSMFVGIVTGGVYHLFNLMFGFEISVMGETLDSMSVGVIAFLALTLLYCAVWVIVIMIPNHPEKENEDDQDY